MSKTDLAAARAYSITQAADIKGVSPNTIRRAIKATEGECLRDKSVGKS